MALIRIRDYAAAHGVTPAAIYLAIENGLIERRGRGLIDDEQAGIWARRYQQNGAARQQTAEAEAQRAHALLQTTIAKVQMTRTRARRLRAKLIDRDETTRGLLSIVHQLNAGLLAMSRDADPLIAEAGRIGLLELAGLQDEALQVTRQE